MIQVSENKELIEQRNYLLRKLSENGLSDDERIGLLGDVGRLDASIASNVRSNLSVALVNVEKHEDEFVKITTGDLKKSYKHLYAEVIKEYREAFSVVKRYVDLKKRMREYGRLLNEKNQKRLKA